MATEENIKEKSAQDEGNIVKYKKQDELLPFHNPLEQDDKKFTQQQDAENEGKSIEAQRESD